MNRNRNTTYRSQRSRDPLERRMDQLVETGRQLVDGVAGNRPGQRRKEDRSGLNDMGKWVGEKIDWLFEEEDWHDPVELKTESQINISDTKKPLRAISLRVNKLLSPASSPENFQLQDKEDWPEESLFKVQRWERERTASNFPIEHKNSLSSTSPDNANKRPLPRSSRRRT